jgi:nucleotide-binding universal stress UspA family protein
VVMTAIDPKAQRAAAQWGKDPEIGSNLDLWAEDRLSRENLEVCGRFKGLVRSCTQRVERGDANAAIRTVMRQENADLLILGAQGHGFLDRLQHGSVSFHQVVAESYSVLLLRA